ESAGILPMCVILPIRVTRGAGVASARAIRSRADDHPASRRADGVRATRAEPCWLGVLARDLRRPAPGGGRRRVAEAAARAHPDPRQRTRPGDRDDLVPRPPP